MGGFPRNFPRREISLKGFKVRGLNIIRFGSIKSNPFCPPPRGCAGGRIGTKFLCPRGMSPLNGVNPVGTPGYRNGTESFFGLKGRPSVVRDV